MSRVCSEETLYFQRVVEFYCVYVCCVHVVYNNVLSSLDLLLFLINFIYSISIDTIPLYLCKFMELLFFFFLFALSVMILSCNKSTIVIYNGDKYQFFISFHITHIITQTYLTSNYIFLGVFFFNSFCSLCTLLCWNIYSFV